MDKGWREITNDSIPTPFVCYFRVFLYIRHFCFVLIVTYLITF